MNSKEAVIKRNKRKLEKKLKVKITFVEGKINFEGDEVNIYIAEKVIEAIKNGFEVYEALLLTKEDYVFEQVQIKQVTKRDNLEFIRARIIGTRGKVIKTLGEITGCSVKLNDNVVSIIGPGEKTKNLITAIESLIHGSKITNVYQFLEKQNKKLNPEDLGLKE